MKDYRLILRMDGQSNMVDGVSRVASTNLFRVLSQMLSGATDVVSKSCDRVAVSASQQNIHLLHKLLRQLRVMIDCACWGRPLGSTQLWENHLVTINRILSIANTIQIREVSLLITDRGHTLTT